MVYRIYVEKKKELANEAKSLRAEINEFLGIENLVDLRLINRYDVEEISKELFDYAVNTVFSEPQLDVVYDTLEEDDAVTFAVSFLPGQFDQRADSAAQCIQIISKGARPLVRSAKVYKLYGDLQEDEIAAIKKYVINPVEAKETSLALPDTIVQNYDIPSQVETIQGFTAFTEQDLKAFLDEKGLAMDADDLAFCQRYFKEEGREPTITEIRMIDTYWSDHCRHTTFLTQIDDVVFEDERLKAVYEDYLSVRKLVGRQGPVTLMDLATIAAKYLKSEGRLAHLDESEEINACTVKIKVTVDGEEQDWLLLFKNETHNHPTEIEPFGGAATCIGGAIRDPLSGRGYVYAAMRVTGAADPTLPVAETMQGKLPQRKIVTTAAAGYSSYGNQIGLATGQVDEIYHPGYAAKRMEIGAVVAAVPASHVRREKPLPGDLVVLLGGRTGRDGCGGATGSSKSHTLDSLENCGAEVQKGNAPEERKLQRLFRNPEASKLIKRCNDFGAGGVSVAIGELADGLEIDLNQVPKKYEGLDGTELAISESQERMAVVIEAAEKEHFFALAAKENLEATVVAVVKEEARLRMSWNGETIVDLSRDFLNSNGAEKHIHVVAGAQGDYHKELPTDFIAGYQVLAADLNVCSKRGLSERFDSTIGAGTVLMPFGGRYQLTPIQAMVNKISVEKGHTQDCSVMAWGYNPFIMEKSPYHGAYLAVVESIAKCVATGASFTQVYLTFQEYFEKMLKDPRRWGKPLAALLGAYAAQKDLGVASIGGKDSMSGSFEQLDVPPTLVSFAVTTEKADHILSPEFKAAGHQVVLLTPEYNEDGLPKAESLLALFSKVTSLMREGKVVAAYTPTYGGVAEAIMKMCFGNGFGFAFENLSMDTLFGYGYGSFILEVTEPVSGTLLGVTTEKAALNMNGEEIALETLLSLYENRLESVFPCNIEQNSGALQAFMYKTETIATPKALVARPRVLIPVFPGTNCEYDTAKAFYDAGAEPEIFVIQNGTKEQVAKSVQYFADKIKQAQIIFVPGGFSGGDEPDGSGKFITAFFRNEAIKEQVHELLKNRDGLMAGICNGFQALIKLGLVPFGEIREADERAPTLTFNTIGRHQSRLVRTRVASNLSPWLSGVQPGDIFTVPISHGEGRFLCSDEWVQKLAAGGQIATQYVDLAGAVTDDVHFNPNNSVCAIEGITSPDGRVFGKMGHSERIGKGLYKNVPGLYDMKLFESAVKYFKG
ncbi:MAG: phosphoribosylformylglycinamidine synthase [Clostridiales bacterium]|nr:phosphoribosylformylglycinamidine synthase [Clostridiales bacterium]